jgi:hypothetical protein
MAIRHTPKTTHYKVTLRSHEDETQCFDLGVYQTTDYEAALVRARNKFRSLLDKMQTGRYYLTAQAQYGTEQIVRQAPVNDVTILGMVKSEKQPAG